MVWKYFTPFSGFSIVDFEQVNVSWEVDFSAVVFLWILQNF